MTQFGMRISECGIKNACRTQLLIPHSAFAIPHFLVAHRTEPLIIDQFGDRRMFAADRAFLVPGDLYGAKAHIERVPEQEFPFERMTDLENRLDHLGGLDRPDHAGHDAQDARLLAGRHHAGRRRDLEETTVAWPLARNDGHHLPLEPEDCRAHQRFLEHDTGVIDEVAGRKAVAPVHDDIVVLDDVLDVRRREPFLVGHNLHIMVQRLVGLFRRIRLEHAKHFRVVRDLALQVRYLDAVIVNHADRANARSGKIVPYRRAEPAGADEHDPRVQDLLLAYAPHLGEQDVPAVAQYLVFAEFHDLISDCGFQISDCEMLFPFRIPQSAFHNYFFSFSLSFRTKICHSFSAGWSIFRTFCPSFSILLGTFSTAGL